MASLITTNNTHDNLIINHDNLIVNHDKLIMNHDNLIMNHDNLIMNHDNLIMNHDNLIMNHDKLIVRSGVELSQDVERCHHGYTMFILNLQVHLHPRPNKDELMSREEPSARDRGQMESHEDNLETDSGGDPHGDPDRDQERDPEGESERDSEGDSGGDPHGDPQRDSEGDSGGDPHGDPHGDSEGDPGGDPHGDPDRDQERDPEGESERDPERDSGGDPERDSEGDPGLPPGVDPEGDPGVAELQLKVRSLKEQLHDCRAELAKLQKQLSHSERLQRNTENYNEDLRKQVDQLSAEIHRRKKKQRGRKDCETQTEEYTWTETDYYNYYYGSTYENPEAVNGQDLAVAVGQEAAEAGEATEVSATTEAVPDECGQPDANTAAKTEEGGEASIADILRATAEQAMTQTGFVFDETTGMYYDHSTGFYYDSASQLYYDNNTGIYYCYDADSGRYQFHSKIEVLPTAAEPDHKPPERKGKTSKKGTKKSSHNHKEPLSDGIKLEEEEEWVERRPVKRSAASRKPRQQSSSPDDSSPRRRDSSKSRQERKERKKRRSVSHSDDEGSARKKRKKAKSEKHKKNKKKKKKSKKSKKARSSDSDDSDGDSEPEEGELSESEGEKESSPSLSSSSSPAGDGAESDMEAESQEATDIWPPCVRVTVVRSPVLQVGTLYIITADGPATIGREKDMDHAIRIAEMGVSKFHAEVFFDQDQQCYMLVDQGSQNGTVLNGNRILQPKIKCEPCALTHGDEVKMGETVLSFHIHSGTDTCDGCEPGQVMAHLSKHKREETAVPIGPIKEEKEVLRQKELRQMKAKYGLKSSEYEEAKALRNPRYQDRAESRRQTVGSAGTFQRDDAPASVHVEISDVNKGRKMLEKMGWKRGDGLGKDGKGMRDPIQLKIRKSQSGLGAGTAVSPDDAALLTPSRSSSNWQKARERFADTCQPGGAAPGGAAPGGAPAAKERSPRAWLKAGDPAAADTQADGDNQSQGSG
ncbi:unnamed protein product [Merluccius merluccius]